MKKLCVFIAVLVVAVPAAIFVLRADEAKPTTAAAEKQLYTCGMHPQVIRDQPGNCPICGMKLIPIRKQPVLAATGERKIKGYKSTMMPGEISPSPKKDSMGMDMVAVYEEESATSGYSTISIDPVTIQNMNMRTDVVTRGPVRRNLRTVGTIDFDETHLTDVTTKFGGWVEKLYADTTGQQVQRGDPLFELYSPDFYKGQLEFIAAINSAASMPSSAGQLRAAARTNLLFMGVPAEQVAELERSRKSKARRTFLVTAPQDGFLVEKMVVQGQKVEEGMKLYRIADLGLVWVQAQIYEQDLPFVTLGQEADVSLSYMPDRKFRGRVNYIYPTVDEKTRTAKIRMEFHNPGYLLKPGMFATVELKAELAKDAVLVPDSAVLRSGEKNTVFVALAGGKFDPRAITLGSRADGGSYQVLSGLAEGERVVTSGQFMLDSESQLREAIQKMLNPNADTLQGGAGSPLPAASVDKPDDGAHGVTRPTRQTASTNAIYICPMPEHVSIRYDHPGKCSLCGMSLVPVSEATLQKIQPGGHIEYYTCPMTADCPKPGHGDAHFDKPGKCPVCGMTLIPMMATETKAAATSEIALPKLYTCPMASHSDVVTAKPGDCPKCGMALVPTSEVEHGKIAEENWRKEHQH